MNRTTVSPAPARTDVEAPAPSVAGLDAGTVRSIRRRGYGMAAGAVIWAATIFVWGTNPESSIGVTVNDLGGLAFQAGVMGLIGAMALTGATGTSRLARTMIHVERVLLSLAMLWTVLHALVPAWRDETWLAVLDAFWPLSMLGMFVLGLKIAVAGRWRGVARIWPMVAESWAVVTVPTFLLVGEPVSNWVGGGHLLIGYTVLGLILARRTGLVLPRR